jgi:hypothetical protein
MFNIHVKYFYVVLAISSDNDQYWPKKVKTKFHIVTCITDYRRDLDWMIGFINN